MKHLNKTKIGTLVISLLLAITALFALYGCSLFESSDDGTSTSSGNTGTRQKLELSDVKMTYSYSEYIGYTVKISGTAKNTSGKSYSYASVEFSVYGESGSNLGTALDNINNLGKGDVWNFEATLFDFPKEKPASYKLVEITAW